MYTALLQLGALFHSCLELSPSIQLGLATKATLSWSRGQEESKVGAGAERPSDHS